MPEPAPGFGEQLRRYRERAGLSQEALAERAQLTTSGIAALERGRRRRPYPDTLRRLAEALALSVEERAGFGVALPPPSVHTTGNQPPAAALPPNLPSPRTSLVGREDAVAALVELVPAHPGRLVTLTGIGGGGKTRLALQVAAEVRTTFPDGAWLVELAPLADPALVPLAVATALAVPEVAGVPVLDCLVAALRARTLLLVLDNCEHLIDACAALAERLLAGCPGVRIFATSREPLQLAGERQWRVPPLSLPEPERAMPLEALAHCPAVQLFVERARAVDAGFGLTAQNAAAIAQVCTELAGIPLALELAATHVRVLAVAQIRDRLADSLRLLTGNSRAAPTRQQTMRAALDWSYDLLLAPEQGVFRRLAAFVGTFDLAAVEAVCAVADLPAEEVLTLLTQLVDKSSVLVEQGAETARYHLLEPVRQYALARLTEYEELENTRARHAAHYVALAERAAPALAGPAQVGWLERLEAEHDNLQAALGWAVTRGDATAGLRLAVALAPFWEGRGHLSEGRRWLATLQALPTASAVSATLRAQALLAAGRLAQWQADLDAAAAALDACLALARRQDDQRLVADALAWLGTVRRQQGAFTCSVALLERSLVLQRAADHAAGMAMSLLSLGVTCRFQGDLERSSTLLEESLARYRVLGDVRFSAMACTMLGFTLFEQGDPDRAAALLREGLLGHQSVGNRAFVVFSLMDLAGVLAAQGQAQRAAQLLGAMAALRDVLAAPLSTSSERTYTRIEAAVRSRLGPAAFAAAWNAGRALPLDAVMTIALEEPPREVSAATLAPTDRAKDEPDVAPESLTPREHEVARLLKQGYTNRQIASVLAISPRTVGVHVQHVLAKLGVRSRWQIDDGARASDPSPAPTYAP